MNVTKTMNVTNFILSTILLLFFTLSVEAAPGGGGGVHTKITTVFVDDPDDPTTIMIVGEELLFGDDPLEVMLGVYVAPLDIIGVPTNTEINALLPESIVDGDYLLTVATGNGKSEKDEYDLTIGGVGPQGDQGVQGKLGDQGVQGKLGDQGVQGKIGDQGVQGKLGDQGVQGKLGPPGPVGGTGDNVVFNPVAPANMQPYNVVNYIIAVDGLFPSRSSSQPYLGEIFMFAGNFAPRGFALCDGQLLSISSNTALFSILGTTYGGDGRTSFGLPDLRGRAPLHAGDGPGLTPRQLGNKGGTETEPAHNHLHQ